MDQVKEQPAEPKSSGSMSTANRQSHWVGLPKSGVLGGACGDGNKTMRDRGYIEVRAARRVE